MSFNVGFYMIDHRLIALVMFLLLPAFCEIGFRLGCRGRDSKESFRSLMTGTGAAMLGLLIGVVLLLIMDVNRPQRGMINIGVESLERVIETMEAPSPQALLENGVTRTEGTEA